MGIGRLAFASLTQSMRATGTNHESHCREVKSRRHRMALPAIVRSCRRLSKARRGGANAAMTASPSCCRTAKS